jgi:hypothetical protein
MKVSSAHTADLQKGQQAIILGHALFRAESGLWCCTGCLVLSLSLSLYPSCLMCCIVVRVVGCIRTPSDVYNWNHRQLCALEWRTCIDPNRWCRAQGQ